MVCSHILSQPNFFALTIHGHCTPPCLVWTIFGNDCKCCHVPPHSGIFVWKWKTPLNWKPFCMLACIGHGMYCCETYLENGQGQFWNYISFILVWNQKPSSPLWNVFLAQYNVFLILMIYVKRSHNSRTPPLPKSRDCTAFLLTTRGIGASYHRHDRSNIRSETPGVRAFRNLRPPLPPSSA